MVLNLDSARVFLEVFNVCAHFTFESVFSEWDVRDFFKPTRSHRSVLSNRNRCVTSTLVHDDPDDTAIKQSAEVRKVVSMNCART